MPDINETLEFTGERFCPQLKGDIALEHMLRYRIAAELAKGKDVLDIACGEGYGSNLLAQKAKSVLGMDISEEAVKHARNVYSASGLEFRTGDAAQISLPDSSVDFAVSFETIEHHARQGEMLDELRRVLRPDGILLLSSPERAMNEDLRGHNPWHVRELYRHELEEMISSRFARYAFYGQDTVFGSVLYGASAPLAWNGAGSLDMANMPKFHMVIATNGENLPKLPSVVMGGLVADSEFYQLRQQEWERKREAMEAREAELMRKQEYLLQKQENLLTYQRELEEANASLHAHVSGQEEFVQKQAEEIEEYMKYVNELKKRADSLKKMWQTVKSCLMSSSIPAPGK